MKPKLTNIKYIVTIGSGKGGVGKSIIATNIAYSMRSMGISVGLLDADIYGPNQPKILSTYRKTFINDKQEIEPVIIDDIQTMSVGYFFEEETPLNLRGPMISKILEQILFQTNWLNVDCLIIDLPPGTGDVQLSLLKKINIDGSVFVTIPQDISVLDTKKAMKMFQDSKIPILGIIENMSTYICNKCGNKQEIFKQRDEVSVIAEKFSTPILGRIPIDRIVRTNKNYRFYSSGKTNQSKSVIFEIYRKMTEKILKTLQLCFEG